MATKKNSVSRKKPAPGRLARERKRPKACKVLFQTKFAPSTR